MQPLDTSKSTPIYPGYVAAISSPPEFGTSPFKFVPQFRGLKACACGPVGGCNCNPPGMNGLRGSGGGTATQDYTLDSYGLEGLQPGGSQYGLAGLKGSTGALIPDYNGIDYGMGKLGQTASLDQIIANAASWLGGFAQSQLPASAAVAPQYGSVGAVGTQLMQWAPYLIIGYLAYKLIK